MTEANDLKIKRVCILLSGGIDSAACVYYYKTRGFSITPIFVDFGQLARINEARSAEEIAKYYNLELISIHASGMKNFSDGEIVGRNLFLVSTSLMAIPSFSGIICLGIHSGTDYFDCQPRFLEELNILISALTNGRVIVNAPFLNFNKLEIAEYCTTQRLPVHLTYSCELGLTQPCGKCLSCKDLMSIYASKEVDS